MKNFHSFCVGKCLVLHLKGKRKKVEEKPAPVSDPSVEEEKSFSEFQKAIKDFVKPYHSDIALRRFLKARNFDVKEAEKLLRLDINFRKILELENPYLTNIPEVINYFRISDTIGFDKEGDIVRIINIGYADLKGIVHSLSTVELIKGIVCCLARDYRVLEEENKKKGKTANRIVFIVNLDGLTTSQILYKPVLDTALLGLKLFQEHFYGIWKNIFVINAPSYFSSVYKLLKPVILDELHKKIEIYTDNWKDVLLEHIDAETLPEFLGGSKKGITDDINSNNMLTIATAIPESFHASPEDFLDPKDPSVESVTVAPGGFVNIPVPVIVDGSIIKYYVNSKDNDISIGVFYEPNSAMCHIEKFKKKDDPKEVLAKLEQLTPFIRSQCHVKAEVGQLLAYKSGMYIIHFDNTYSWMNSKQVYYKFDVSLPESEQLIGDSNIIENTENLKISSRNGTG